MDLSKRISTFAVLVLALVFAFVKQGVAITCYMCNSAVYRNGEACETLTGDTSVFKQDCDQLTHPNNLNYTVCRKMYQIIYDNDGKEEERIIRQCGSSESPLGCERKTRPNTLQVHTCHCATDLCNAAPRSAFSTPHAVLMWLCAAAVLIVVEVLPFRRGAAVVGVL
ncbi:uncharacterized protein LOC143287055 [Babylonia areolata]|uniref:uncharacterized protein LOC143287055 n=1 Tax=Babylonia areolata TaxID=304850 RepID=UPI003FD12252